MLVSALAAISLSATAQTNAPSGEITGSAWAHTADSLLATVRDAVVVLPAKATGAKVFVGKFKDIPRLSGERVPVVLFLHGSSGLGLKAIGEWQRWLAVTSRRSTRSPTSASTRCALRKSRRP
ncbi:MAG: hypothetical protein NT159_04095 [Proteobacteria bacterium]|nr:hypothetical protein [Pseudomonadota bacterium]